MALKNVSILTGYSAVSFCFVSSLSFKMLMNIELAHNIGVKPIYLGSVLIFCYIFCSISFSIEMGKYSTCRKVLNQIVGI